MSSSRAETPGSSPPSPAGPGAREDGVWLETAGNVAVDLLVDDERVWSFNPSRDGKREGHLYRVPWPEVLRPWLVGVGRVTAREHVSGRVLFDEETRFGDSDERLRFVDEDGHHVVVNKSGVKASKLKRSFADRDPETIHTLLNVAEKALAFLRDAGVPAFAAYGTLLGAVRDGHIIGHDDDVDLGIVTPSPYPVDAIRASFQLERMFRRAGWQTWRFSAADFKVRAAGVEDHPWIDIFGGFYADGTFYLMGRLAAPADKLQVLPLSEVELEGHKLAAPADPAAMLEAAYGPGWRFPDPSYVPDIPRSTVRRVNGWVRSGMTKRKYWYRMYGPAAGTLPTTPSPFARWFADREPGNAPVVDIGSGNGRDAVWLAEQGHPVRGYDFVLSAPILSRRLARERGVKAQFYNFNLYDLRHVLALGGLLAHEPDPVHLYARFVLHAVTDLGVRNLWTLARTSLRRGGRLYLEFLAPDPSGEPPTSPFGDHFMRPLEPSAVAAQIRARGGRVEHQEVGRGRAVYQDNDPYVCRMVARWSR